MLKFSIKYEIQLQKGSLGSFLQVDGFSRCCLMSSSVINDRR